MNKVSWLLLAMVALLAGGCAGYRLGPTGGAVAGGRSLQVNPFLNETLEPRLTDPVAWQLRKQLQRDSTFRLASGQDADVVVTGVLTRYARQGMTFVPRDVETVQDYRLSLTAQVTVRERASGKLLLDQAVTGHTMIRVGNDLVSSERQALPLLAEDLARKITTLLVDGAW